MSLLFIERAEYQDRFLQTYLNDFAQLKELYEYNPKDNQSIPSRISYLDHTGDLQRRRDVCSALLQYNQRMGCNLQTEENIQMLAAGNAYAVVTGQQTGLLTGPMYTVYKIMTTISLAEKITREQGIKAVPVFWAASEDHDFQEVSTVTIINEDMTVVDYSVPSPIPGRISIGHLPLNERIRETVEFLAESIPDSIHRDHYLQILNETYDDSASFADWCSRIIAKLFARYGLIMLDSLDPALRVLSVDIFRRGVLYEDEINRAIASASKKIEILGFKPQLQIAPDALPLFSNTASGRHLIHQTDGKQLYVHGNEAVKWAPAELAAEIAAHPEQFSPNVVLRPMVQDHLLPTIAYVAGPGELAYYAQLRAVYPLMGQQMPIIYPRFSATLILPEIAELMADLALASDEILPHDRDVIDRIISERAPFSVNERFSHLQADIEELYRVLIEDIATVDSDLKKIAEGNLGRILKQVDYLARKTQQKVRKKEKGTVVKIEKVLTYFYPGHQPQERSVNVFPFLFRYGEHLLDHIMAANPADSFEHIYVYLGDDDHR